MTLIAVEEDLGNTVSVVDGGSLMAIGHFLARELDKKRRWDFKLEWYFGQSFSGKWFQEGTTRFHSLMDTYHEGGVRIPPFFRGGGTLHAVYPLEILASCWIYRVWIDGGSVTCKLIDRLDLMKDFLWWRSSLIKVSFEYRGKTSEKQKLLFTVYCVYAEFSRIMVFDFICLFKS